MTQIGNQVCKCNKLSLKQNLKSVQNMFKYHLNFQNILKLLKYKFVTHKLSKNLKGVKNTLQDPKLQQSM